MNRRVFVTAATVLGAALALQGCGTTRPSVVDVPAGRPNIVFVLADDLGYGDLGCYGSEAIQTPNIDALAQNGLRFTDFYVSAPVCSPSRAGFLTGRSHQRCGAEFIFRPGKPEDGLPLNETTVADVLQARGYVTGIFGKWHLGYAEPFNPIRRGFDQFVGLLSGYVDYHSHVNPMLGHDWWDGLERADEGGYATDLIARHSIDFLRAHSTEPFFLFVSHQAPHSPYQGPEDGVVFDWERGRNSTYINTLAYPQERRRAAYVKMVERLDKTVGDLLAVLREEGLEERTLVIFASDNGPSAYAGSAGGLSGGKHSLREGGIRVPAIAYWPGMIKPGRVSNQPVTNLDMFPTFVALAGTSPPPSLELDGADLTGLLLRGDDLPKRTLCWRYGGHAAVRSGKWSLLGKYASAKGGVTFQALYDLSGDENQSADVSDANPGIVEDLKAAYSAWIESIASDRKRLERMPPSS